MSGFFYVCLIKKTKKMKQLTPEEIKKKRTNKFMTYGCLPVFAFFGILFIIALIASGDEDEFSKDKTTSAYIASKQIVKAQLAFPEEAEFPILPVLSEIQESTDSIYRVVGDVVGKNAMGLKIKNRYMVRMKYRGGDPNMARSWEIIDFTGLE